MKWTARQGLELVMKDFGQEVNDELHVSDVVVMKRFNHVLKN